ncbi:MAG: hypothetical protein R6U50_03900 [Desulfobacterales bacterium]
MLKRTIWLLVGFIFLAAAAVYWVWHRTPVPERQPWSVRDGLPSLGRQAMIGYGCTACHVIPGIRKATGRVGPKLNDIGVQIYIGGVLPNTPGNMVAWVRNPLKFSPETAMPDLGVSTREAMNIAAYLYEN